MNDIQNHLYAHWEVAKLTCCTIVSRTERNFLNAFLCCAFLVQETIMVRALSSAFVVLIFHFYFYNPKYFHVKEYDHSKRLWKLSDLPIKSTWWYWIFSWTMLTTKKICGVCFKAGRLKCMEWWSLEALVSAMYCLSSECFSICGILMEISGDSF